MSDSEPSLGANASVDIGVRGDDYATDNNSFEITTPSSKEDENYADICIIGGGAAGCLLAYLLTLKDKKVVLIEKGAYYNSDYIKRQPEEKLSKLWKNGGIFLSKSYSINIAQGECLGGSTMINYGICFQIPRPVLDYWNSAFGLNISIDEYQQAYNKISVLFGVTKVKDPGKGHELFKSGCEGLGYSAGWMDKAYSPKGEKNNAFEAFLKSSKLENLKVFTNSRVDRVVFSNKKAIAVKGVCHHPADKRQHNFSVSAKCFILCSGAIGSSELLLKSGYSGKNDQVGQHLSLHPSSSVLAQFEEDIDGESGVAMACYCDEFSVRKTGKPGFMLESVFVPPSQMSITLPSYGQENRKYLKKYRNYAMAGVLVQDEPNGQVELNWNQDAVVGYDLGKADQSKMIDGIKEAARIFFRAGAKSVLTGHMIPTRLEGIGDLGLVNSRGAGMGTLLLASAHPQGGNRMGNDPSNSVVNRYGRLHDIHNLFVCDSSIFPTSVGVNPQMTVLSIALLSADYIESVV